MIDDLVDILYPWPTAEDVPDGDEDVLDSGRDDVSAEREAYEQNLRTHEENDDGDYDPLISEINAARREMRNAEARMRMLVAYGREFIKPQPYQLKDPRRCDRDVDLRYPQLVHGRGDRCRRPPHWPAAAVPRGGPQH